MSASDWVKELGLPAYRVGGSVRDALLDRPSSDDDFVLLAAPEEIKAAVMRSGRRAQDLVVRDRLVGIRAYGAGLPPAGVEIAPPRVERSTGPGRHDFEIVPHPAAGDPRADPQEVLADDAERRDFTVNALYQNLDGGHVLDPTERGLVDLRERVLRTTHAHSFRDDPLRILRAARLASQLGFDPEAHTLSQMREHADAVTGLTRAGVSGTVQAELDKLLTSTDAAKGLRLLRDTGVLEHLLPELPAPMEDERIARVARAGSLEARLALLLESAAKPVLERLNYPRRTIADVALLAERRELSALPREVRRLRGDLGDELLAQLLDVARLRGDAPAATLDEIAALARASRDAADPVRVRDLAVTGTDLMEAGIEEGPEVGRILHELLERVLDEPALNRREILLKTVGAPH